ncbi:MAG TPA: hypothetical protein VJ975_00230 [Candidatus Limnocylindria bacterium]|nr:hypothetical protein [Candidatus Limnocylindria bacterium]
MKLIGPVIIGLVAVACAGPTTSPSLLSSDSATATAVASHSPTVPSPSPTSVAQTATDLLECVGPVSPMGGRADEFGGSTARGTPEQALESFVTESFFTIPRSGYSRLGAAGDRTVFTYAADGKTKVVVVVSSRFSDPVRGGITVEELRSCDPAEFGGVVDLGPEQRAWTNLDTGMILIDIVGPQHCGWQSARMLHVNRPDGSFWKQYLRDPQGVFDEARLLDTYAEGVELPRDASDSRYRSPDGYELWFSESDTAAYVVTPHGVERWPRPADGIGCA